MLELLTGILILVTAFYAWSTYRILHANEKVVEVMREQSTAILRPYITIVPFLEPDNPVIYLRIANIGKTPANNLHLNISKSFFKFDGPKDIATFSLFNQPIDSFAPGAEIILSLAQGFEIFKNDIENPRLPRAVSVTVKYLFGNQEITEVNAIDLRPYLNSDIPQNEYVRKLKDIAESLKIIASK